MNDYLRRAAQYIPSAVLIASSIVFFRLSSKSCDTADEFSQEAQIEETYAERDARLGGKIGAGLCIPGGLTLLAGGAYACRIRREHQLEDRLEEK